MVVPENKVWKIPYGVSNHRFSADFNRDVKRKDVVLFVGYVSARKGIAVLVQTIKLVRDRFPNIELWLVGDRDRRLPEALFNYSWIKCWGILRGPALSDCLSKGQSFLSSVVRRGPGVGSDGSVCNAGCRLFATHNTGAGEFIEDGKEGFLVPAGNSNLMADRICKLLADEETYNQMVRSIEKRATQCTWHSFVDTLAHCIKTST